MKLSIELGDVKLKEVTITRTDYQPVPLGANPRDFNKKVKSKGWVLETKHPLLLACAIQTITGARPTCGSNRVYLESRSDGVRFMKALGLE